MRKRLSSIILLVAAILLPGLATAQQAPTNTRFYWASDYNYTIQNQQANVYTFFPIGICQQVGTGGIFFPFATNASIYISDAVSANNETLTPSAVINTSANCGVTISPSNTHNSFKIVSATGGLQEALNQLPSTLSSAVVVYLDRNWYQNVAAVGGTAATIIAGAKGNSKVNLVDITTVPFTTYVANGAAAYVQQSGPASVQTPVLTGSAYTNATTTFSNVTGLSFPVAPSKNYTATCTIIWQGSAATSGPKYQFTGPAAPTAVAASAWSTVTASTFTEAAATAFSSPMANAGTVTTATNFVDTVTIGVVNGVNGGTVQLQAAANGAGTLTIQPGSYCKVQ